MRFKNISRISKFSEYYHNFLTWQEVVKCQKCGKVIGVCGVSYGHESDIEEKIKKVQEIQ